MTRFVVNTAVISRPGVYRYRVISRAEARAWLAQGPVMSRVGYPATADYIRRVFGLAVDLNREATIMHAGDQALVVRLKYRLPDTAPKAVDSGWDAKADDFEIGLLVLVEENDHE